MKETKPNSGIGEGSKLAILIMMIGLLFLAIFFMAHRAIMTSILSNREAIHQVHSSLMSFQDYVLKLKAGNVPAIKVGRADRLDILNAPGDIIVQLRAVGMKGSEDDNDDWPIDDDDGVLVRNKKDKRDKDPKGKEVVESTKKSDKVNGKK